MALFVGPITTRPAARRTAQVVSSSRVTILGGSGQIGTAAAIHLLSVLPATKVTLAGRSKGRGQRAVQTVQSKVAGADVCFREVDIADPGALKRVLDGTDLVIHTAGPFGEDPSVLREVLSIGVRHYVDVADPVPYIERGTAMETESTTAVLAAGAFPGLSNLLALECARVLDDQVESIDFSYFTAGLGGSGAINLYITNVGFGTPVPVFRDGQPSPQLNAGKDLRTVEFFLDEKDESFRRIGTRRVWAWPFPEAETVARELKVTGSSNVRMGTAPDIWNDIMSAMVDVVPRSWWLNPRFSAAVADFSQPLVTVADAMLGVETHGMRIDVTGKQGGRVAALQAHQSFRTCVGQSVAEFARYLLENDELPTGVFTPEQLFRDHSRRADIIKNMTTTPGTFTFRIEPLT